MRKRCLRIIPCHLNESNSIDPTLFYDYSLGKDSATDHRQFNQKFLTPIKGISVEKVMPKFRELEYNTSRERTRTSPNYSRGKFHGSSSANRNHFSRKDSRQRSPHGRHPSERKRISGGIGRNERSFDSSKGYKYKTVEYKQSSSKLVDRERWDYEFNVSRSRSFETHSKSYDNKKELTSHRNTTDHERYSDNFWRGSSKDRNAGGSKSASGKNDFERDRWDHSGFKELYRDDSRNSETPQRRNRRKHKESLSRSRSRSRSPLALHKKEKLSKNWKPSEHSRNIRLKEKNRQNISVTPANKLANEKDSRIQKDKEVTSPASLKTRNVSKISRTENSADRNNTFTGSVSREALPGKRSKGQRQHEVSLMKSKVAPVRQDDNRRSVRNRSLSGSVSDDRSGGLPSPRIRSQINRPMEKDRNKSKSLSSTESSSSDEDVLEIHARTGRRHASLSPRSSSDDDRDARHMHRQSSNSSTSTSSQATEDLKDERNSRETTSKTNTSNFMSTNVSTRGKEAGAGANETQHSVTTGENLKSSEIKSSSETESDSSSSDDSDEEPRMTLSERFAKLTQFSRDKREFAKPEISVDEIDTKLKVVKDLKNSSIKILVKDPTNKNGNFSSKSNFHVQQSDDTFKFRDRKPRGGQWTFTEPLESERPASWSNLHVRYNYYKEQGCFDERPITIEEFEKWETWYFEYRDWLEHQGYFDRQNNGKWSDDQPNYHHPPPPRHFPPQHVRNILPVEPVARHVQYSPSLHHQNNFNYGNRNERGPSLAEPFFIPKHGPTPHDAHRGAAIQIRGPPPLEERFGGSGGNQPFRIPMIGRIESPINNNNRFRQAHEPNFQGGGGRGRLAGRIGFRR